MKYKLSIIIPIYNVEKYLEFTLQSILKQTIGHENLQVIMVDDCSTDNTKKIINKYTNKYSNFQSVFLKECSKVAGKPRNEGLKLVEAEFVMFTDGDDFYDEKACETMYNAINKYEADMITANYNNADQDGVKWENPIFNKNDFKTFLLNDIEFTKSFFVLNSSVCNKIFRNAFIKENNIKFLEGVPGEDAFFTFSYFLKSKKVYYIEDIIYYYRNRSASHDSVSWNCSKNYFNGINISYKALYEVFTSAGRLDYYRYFYSKSLTYMIYKFIDSTLITNEDRKEILKEMSWFYEKSKLLDVVPVQESLKILIELIINKKYDEAIDVCIIIKELREFIPKELREKMSKPKEIFYKKI